MKLLTFGDNDLLTGDEVADLVIEYSVVLARASDADAVDIEAYDRAGMPVTAKLLLGEGTPVMAATSAAERPEPDNDAVVAYMRHQMELREHPPDVLPVDAPPPPATDDDI